MPFTPPSTLVARVELDLSDGWFDANPKLARRAIEEFIADYSNHDFAVCYRKAGTTTYVATRRA